MADFKPKMIVLHHSLTQDGETVSWQAIRRYHMAWKCDGVAVTPESVNDLMAQGMPVQRPWRDIGYHFGIERIGGRYEVLAGRMITEMGAHCSARHANYTSLGICFVGNFDEVPPPKEQWDLGVRLVASLCDVLGIAVVNIYGHRELATSRSCPGHAFDLEQFKQQVEDFGTLWA